MAGGLQIEIPIFVQCNKMWVFCQNYGGALKTGELQFANAGHNPPLLKKKKLLSKSHGSELWYFSDNKEITSYQIEHLFSHHEDKDLKYDWSNLFLACAHCNNINIEISNNL